MPDVSWELNVKVGGGPHIAKSDTLVTEAYGEIEVTIKKNDKEKKIDVQPAASGNIKFVLIAASQYSDKLFYTLKKGASAKQIKLDAPQFFIGAGMIELLDPAPQEIYVTNNLQEDVKLNIIVGRDATP